MRQVRLFLAFGFIGLALASSHAMGQSRETIAPPRAALLVKHLRQLPFKPIATGLSYLRTVSPEGVELIALRISAAHFKARVELQNVNKGEMVAQMGTRAGALIAINGGFFSVNKKGDKVPVGLLAIQGKKLSTPWKTNGGYLNLHEGAITIIPTRNNAIPKGEAVLQSKPMLIEPGGKWAMNTNGAIARKRTLICNDTKGDIIVLAIIGGGLSLFEAGWLMRTDELGGYFNCDSALAMDGGGSTQIWVKDRPDLSYAGETPVHNAVVILPR